MGSVGKVSYNYDAQGKPVLRKDSKLLLNNNDAGKPEGIHMAIGRQPIMTFGNTDGDRQMLEYGMEGSSARLAMLVQRDDETREYAYGPAQGLRDTKVDAFSQDIFDEAVADGWNVVSMKNDLTRIFPFDK